MVFHGFAVFMNNTRGLVEDHLLVRSPILLNLETMYNRLDLMHLGFLKVLDER